MLLLKSSAQVLHCLNDHTSNFGLGTRVDKPDGPNSSDGNDQTIVT